MELLEGDGERASTEDRGAYASLAPHPQTATADTKNLRKEGKKGRIQSALKPAAVMSLDHIQGEDLVEIHSLRATTLCPPLQQHDHLNPAPGNQDKIEGVIF